MWSATSARWNLSLLIRRIFLLLQLLISEMWIGSLKEFSTEQISILSSSDTWIIIHEKVIKKKKSLPYHKSCNKLKKLPEEHVLCIPNMWYCNVVSTNTITACTNRSKGIGALPDSQSSKEISRALSHNPLCLNRAWQMWDVFSVFGQNVNWREKTWIAIQARWLLLMVFSFVMDGEVVIRLGKTSLWLTRNQLFNADQNISFSWELAGL